MAYSGIGAVTWVANAVLAVLTFRYFAPQAQQNPFLHTWSLAVEEQFYIVFPVLVAVVFWAARKNKRKGWRPLVAVVSVATAGSFLGCLILTFVDLPLPVGLTLAFYSPFSRAWEFGIGALVALLARRWQPADGRVSSVLGIGGAALVVAGLILTDDFTSFPGFLVLYPVLGAGLLLMVAQRRNVATSVLEARPLVRVGDISYGWYLYHWPMLVLLRRFWDADQHPSWIDWVAIITSFGVALASYHYVEQPIRQRRMWASVRTPRLAMGLIALPVAISVVLLVAVGHGWWNQNVRSLQAGVSHDYWKVQQTCQDQSRISERDLAACTFPGDPERPGFVLVGDSNAGVYADVLVRAGRKLNRTVTVATIPSCELTPQRTRVPGVRLSFLIDCPDRYKDTMAQLARMPPSIVLIGSGQDPFSIEKVTLEDPDGTTYVGTADMIAGREADLLKTYSALETAGHTVVPIAKLPHFDWMAADCTFVSILRDETTCGATQTIANADKDDGPVMRAMAGAVAALDLQTLDFRDDICVDGICRTNVGDYWIYEDGSHISYRRTMSLLPTMVNRLGTLRVHDRAPGRPDETNRPPRAVR